MFVLRLATASLVALLLIGVGASAVQAQRVVVLPGLSGDSPVPPALQADTRAAVRAALEGLGFELAADVELPADLAECADGECAARVVALADVDLAAGITIWLSRTDPTQAREIVVGLVDAEGNRYNGAAEVSETVAIACLSAVRTARARFTVGPGPFLVVDGDPEGAIVEVDGNVVGSVPWRGQLEPGDHVVSVRQPGYNPQTETVHLGEDRSVTESISIHLTVVTVEEGGADNTLAYVLGIGLGTAGFAVALVPAFGAAGEACEGTLPDGTCYLQRRISVGPAVAYIAVGAALIATGALLGVVLWDDGSDSASGDASSTQIRLAPTGLQLRHRF